MRFSSILLVIDSGTNHTPALQRAIALAESEKASLTICDVVDKIPRSYRRAITSITPREITDLVVADKHERIRKLLRHTDTGSVAVDTRVLSGTPYIEISKQVSTRGHDLVIKSIANRPAAQRRAITRSDRDLLRNCPCPVWLVNSMKRAKKGCIVAAIDKPEEGGTDEVLNRHILEISRSIALAEFRQLHIVHAWQLPGEGHLRSRGTPAAILEADRMTVQEMTARMDWLTRIANEAETESHQAAVEYLAAELHAIKGAPITAVPELAETLGASLIVMGTAGRTGVPGVILGNTSEKVLARSDCSFLIVKRPGIAYAGAAGSEPTQEWYEPKRRQA